MYYNKNFYKLAKMFKTKNKNGGFSYNGNFNSLRKMLSEEEIINLMLLLNYSDENFAIMAGDEDYLRTTNSQLFDDNNIYIRKDGRNMLQYKQDLVAGWLLEELVILKIKQQNPNITVILNGDDKDRIVLTKPTNSVDLKLIYNNKYILVEISMSHTGYCYNQGKFLLKNNKRLQLIEQNAYLLQIETNEKVKKFILLSSQFLKDYEQTDCYKQDNNTIFAHRSLYQDNENLAEVLIDCIENYGKILE